MTQQRKTETGLTQNAAFIRDTYRKAVITGMLSLLSVNINVFVDGILVGSRIGEGALAAVNLCMPLSWALCVIGCFFAAGTEIPAARAIGAGIREKRDLFFRTGLNASVLASVILTALGLALQGPLVSFLCAEESIRGYVTEYAVIMLIGALPKIVMYIPFWYLRLDGKNKDVAVMMAGMAAVNIALDVLFVYGMDLGVFGAGLASVIATALACGYGMIRLLAKGSEYSWRPEMARSREDWRTIAAAGFPSAFSNLCATFRILIINSMLMARGGAGLVAVFTAVNGISGLGDCITMGVPAAGVAMLGVFSGERDNGSCRLLLKEEWKTGCIAGGVFAVLCAVLSGQISGLYGLSENLLVPLLWMGAAVFPALFLNILSTYYNMAAMSRWSGGLILLRSLVMVYAGLLLEAAVPLPDFSFLLLAEAAAAAVWLAATGLHHRRHPGDTRFLMTDLENEKSGRVLNFSVDADVEEIVGASERISEFCGVNGLNARETLRLQMSIEEVMTLIREVNLARGVRDLRFDLRAFSVQNVRGIRFRYSGIPFNPFNPGREAAAGGEDLYMGVQMIEKLVEMVSYQSAFGINTLQVLLKEGEKDAA